MSIPALCHSRFTSHPDSSGTDLSLPLRSLLSGQQLLSAKFLWRIPSRSGTHCRWSTTPAFHISLEHHLSRRGDSYWQVLTGNQCRLWTFHDCSPHTYTHTQYTQYTHCTLSLLDYSKVVWNMSKLWNTNEHNVRKCSLTNSISICVLCLMMLIYSTILRLWSCFNLPEFWLCHAGLLTVFIFMLQRMPCADFRSAMPQNATPIICW